MAQAGFDRTCKSHTYDRRLMDILQFAVARRDSRTLAEPISEANILLPVTTVSLPLRLARTSLVAVCRLIWGRERGLRAARRITFEGSLKLFGEGTFKANGIPGRLFPYI